MGPSNAFVIVSFYYYRAREKRRGFFSISNWGGCHSSFRCHRSEIKIKKFFRASLWQ
jgi:hypothetical protein